MWTSADQHDTPVFPPPQSTKNLRLLYQSGPEIKTIVSIRSLAIRHLIAGTKYAAYGHLFDLR